MRRQARTTTSTKNSNSPRVAGPRLVSAARGSIATFAGVFTLAGVIAVGCDDEDTSRVINTGGNAGSNGMSGASGGGMGGSSAGSAGMGGSSAGSAGTGGDAGSGGTGGGQGGSGSDPDAGDGGPVDGGDAAAALDRNAVAAALCVTLDAVDPCPAITDCANAQITAWDLVYQSYPDCPELADAYYVCISTAPLEDFSCQNDTPGYTGFDPGGACAEEEAFFLGCP